LLAMRIEPCVLKEHEKRSYFFFSFSSTISPLCHQVCRLIFIPGYFLKAREGDENTGETIIRSTNVWEGCVPNLGPLCALLAAPSPAIYQSMNLLPKPHRLHTQTTRFLSSAKNPLRSRPAGPALGLEHVSPSNRRTLRPPSILPIDH
jgi:hypothetical protein